MFEFFCGASVSLSLQSVTGKLHLSQTAPVHAAIFSVTAPFTKVANWFMTADFQNSKHCIIAKMIQNWLGITKNLVTSTVLQIKNFQVNWKVVPIFDASAIMDQSACCYV